MSKKTALIGAIIIMVIWFAIWGFGYWYLGQQVNNASTRGFVQDASVFLSKDDSFADEYGQLTDMKTLSEAPINNEGAATREYYMDFACTTNKGEFTIRVFQYWDEASESWLRRYEPLPAN